MHLEINFQCNFPLYFINISTFMLWHSDNFHHHVYTITDTKGYNIEEFNLFDFCPSSWLTSQKLCSFSLIYIVCLLILTTRLRIWIQKRDVAVRKFIVAVIYFQNCCCPFVLPVITNLDIKHIYAHADKQDSQNFS